MQKRKLVITQNLETGLIQKIERLIPGWQLVVGKNREIWEDHIEDSEIIAGWKKGLEDLCLYPNSKLRWVQSWSAGVNSLPLEKFAENDITLTSANGVHAYPISETIFALMLALTRNIHKYVKNQEEKLWHHSGLKLEIHEKTIGIIGVGAIGKETAKISRAFGMRVLGIKRSGTPEDFVDEMFTLEQLHEVLPQCDFVVITLPLTEETFHLFGDVEFELMKESAFLVNIGRGQIIIEQDLIKALREGKIAGAGLDVFEKEPLEEASPLWEMDNVIITPHTAGSTEHYDRRVIEDIFIPNLKNYLAGENPKCNKVDYQKGY